MSPDAERPPAAEPQPGSRARSAPDSSRPGAPGSQVPHAGREHGPGGDEADWPEEDWPGPGGSQSRVRAWARREPDSPPLPAVLLRGVAAMFIVALLVAAATVGAFVWLDGATPHLVRDDAMQGAVWRGDVAIVRPDAEVRPGVVVRWTDEAGAAHLHRVAALRDGQAHVAADAHRAVVAVVPTDAVEGVAERRVPVAGLPLVWVREGAVGGLLGFATVLGSAIATLVAVPLRAGVVGERSPSQAGGPGGPPAGEPGSRRRSPSPPATASAQGRAGSPQDSGRRDQSAA